MAHKTLIGGTAYEISGGKTLIGGTAYDIAKGRTLVNGVGYDISFTKTLGSVPAGGIVYLNVNGVPTEFIVVNQGNPNPTIYESGFNDTWLLMKDIYKTQAYFGNLSDGRYDPFAVYRKTPIQSTLNTEFYNKLDADVQNLVKQVAIPYIDEDGLLSGENGLSVKVFLLSLYEVGGSHHNANWNNNPDGAILEFFQSAEDSARIAYLNGTATNWWLRTPGLSTAGGQQCSACHVFSSGVTNDSHSTLQRYGVRPALILPKNTVIDDQFNIVT